MEKVYGEPLSLESMRLLKNLQRLGTSELGRTLTARDVADLDPRDTGLDANLEVGKKVTIKLEGFTTIGELRLDIFNEAMGAREYGDRAFSWIFFEVYPSEHVAGDVSMKDGAIQGLYCLGENDHLTMLDLGHGTELASTANMQAEYRAWAEKLFGSDRLQEFFDGPSSCYNMSVDEVNFRKLNETLEEILANGESTVYL